ncbi:MAG: NAD-dependent epimerase/dehydratase family protein [Neisseriaceae bacterium]|nr:NAD-dependent epimerase/dehydratase family protein [Neisseriaceae bacterium]
MNIVLLGGSGFVGSHVAEILRNKGHIVTTPTHKELDLLNPNRQNIEKIFENQYAIINAVGVMSRYAEVLDKVHYQTPKLLAEMAAKMGIKHWVQLSALGADSQYPAEFLASKGRGDNAVLHIMPSVNITRPSVIYGRGGASCELFIKLAKLPILGLPEKGRFLLQPVCVNEVAIGLANMAENPLPHGAIVNMTGGKVVSMAEYLTIMRQNLHHKPPAKMLNIPLSLIKPFLPIAKVLSNGMLSPDSIQMLQDGNTADNGDFARLLGKTPQSPEMFIQAA